MNITMENKKIHDRIQGNFFYLANKSVYDSKKWEREFR